MLRIEPGKQNADGVVVVAMTGSADIHSEGTMEAALTAVAAARPKLVVLDMRSIDLLTSVAIGVLVGFRARLISAGGRAVVVAVPEQVARTMRFTRVSELFARHDSVESAVAAASVVKTGG